MSDLEARIESVNKVNKAVNDLYPILIEIFNRFLNKKALKSDCTLLKSIANLLPDADLGGGVFLEGKNIPHVQTIIFKVSTSVVVNGKYIHESAWIPIGDTQDGVLVSILELITRKCDYKLEDIMEKKEKAKLAYEAYKKAVDDLGPFV